MSKLIIGIVDGKCFALYTEEGDLQLAGNMTIENCVFTTNVDRIYRSSGELTCFMMCLYLVVVLVNFNP